MKVDYRSQIPRGLTFDSAAVSSAFPAMEVLCRRKVRRPVLRLISMLDSAFVGMSFLSSAYLLMLYRIFFYRGKRKLAKHIMNGAVAQVKIPTGGGGLDVGCGNDVLTIAVAK